MYQHRVIFGDTDQMGVVYYANYFRFFEAARAAYLRSLGRSNKDLEEWDAGLPVTEAHCRYRQPARYEDLLDIDVTIPVLRAASMKFVYRIEREGVLLVEGFTMHACVGGDGRPKRLPAPLRALILEDNPGADQLRRG